MGQPVEIQALWYNALKIFAELLMMNGQRSDAVLVNNSAEKAKQHFTELFWNETGKCLYDLIDENESPDASIRPNQLFALSLPFPLIEGEQAAQVLETVTKYLYTPAGLRTLPTSDPRYVAQYGGDGLRRDSSYHQGTVWSWLLGAYIDATMRVHHSAEEARRIVNAFTYHLEEACVGSISEIFDADPPHHPRGCVAQAWSVGELLRVLKEYHL